MTARRRKPQPSADERMRARLAPALEPALVALDAALSAAGIPLTHSRREQLRIALHQEIALAGLYRRDPALAALQPHLGAVAGALYTALDAAGLTVERTTAATDDLATQTALHLAAQHYEAAEHHATAALEAHRTQWRREQEVYTWEEAQAALGWGEPEMQTARELSLIVEVAWPADLRTPVDPASGRVRGSQPGGWDIQQVQTPEGREQVRQATLLSRHQAAAHLGISPAEFDRRRKRAGIQKATHIYGRQRWPLYLYRLVDVETLGEEIG